MSGEDGAVISALIKLCKRQKITCLLQVGAENGYEGDEIRKAIGCLVVCCDPDPRIIPVSNAIEFHEVLIGGTNTVEDFIVHPVQGLSSKVARGENGEYTLTLPQQTVETFCGKHDVEPDALLIDSEGTSMDVLRGCGPVLDGVRLIYCEVQHDQSRGMGGQDSEVEAFLVERGFTRWLELPSYRAGAQSNYTFLRGA